MDSYASFESFESFGFFFSAIISKMRRLWHMLGLMSRWERWTLGILSVLAVLSGALLTRSFYMNNTELVAAEGGTYIEGSVGLLQPLSPWFTVQNDVNRDIVSLVFSGLLRYNPQAKKIEDDLATMDVSGDNKIFTLKLKENVFWQDSTEESPHPVTADDILFTFETIQDPDFPNTLLQENFRGVSVKKIDDRTVRFTLDAPYSFFPSNLTLGLLPRRPFQGVRVQNYDTVDAPGAGPYRIKNIVQTDLSSEVTLERVSRLQKQAYHLDRIVFRIFPDYSTLLSDLRNLQGVRLVNRSSRGEVQTPKGFQGRNYYLPQYVAMFFNLDKKTLQDQKLRIGLQLGTNKQALVDTIGESVLVDTPLLQVDMSDWHYQFDANAAQGALLASKWNIPERIRLQKLLEQDEASKTGIVRAPAVVLGGTGRVLTLSGTYVGMPRGARIANFALQEGVTGSGSWMVRIPLLTGTGALGAGEQLVRVTDDRNKIIDSFYVTVAESKEDFRAAETEQLLMRQYVATKNGGTGPQITIAKLAMDRGRLRMRRTSDAPSIRVNEKGEALRLRLLTSNAPASYRTVAEEVKKEWEQLGVQVEVVIPAERSEFEGKLLRREYDVLLFGQSLLENLDSYPYWHSTGVQKITGQEKDLRRDAYNLSQYTSFKADALLETVRETSDEKVRSKALQDLRVLLGNDVPAIFLYSPLYTYAHRSSILGIELGALSLHSDRFLSLQNWYVKENRVFKPGRSWLSIVPWTFGMLRDK